MNEVIRWSLLNSWASLVAQMVKNLPAKQETPGSYLGQEDPLEKGMATYSSILTWRIPWGRKELSTMTQECLSSSLNVSSSYQRKFEINVFCSCF